MSVYATPSLVAASISSSMFFGVWNLYAGNHPPSGKLPQEPCQSSVSLALSWQLRQKLQPWRAQHSLLFAYRYVKGLAHIASAGFIIPPAYMPPWFKWYRYLVCSTYRLMISKVGSACGWFGHKQWEISYVSCPISTNFVMTFRWGTALHSLGRWPAIKWGRGAISLRESRISKTANHLSHSKISCGIQPRSKRWNLFLLGICQPQRTWYYLYCRIRYTGLFMESSPPSLEVSFTCFSSHLSNIFFLGCVTRPST